jgi:nitrogen fixation NifU-like protein
VSYNQSIYQKIILEHNRSPKNFKQLENATHMCPGNNPLCGDHLTVYLIFKDDQIEDISFKGAGCAISKASASMMTEAVQGKKIEQAKELFENLEDLFKQPRDNSNHEILGELKVFENLKGTSSRIKCVTLAWKTLLGALEQKSEISTEKE